MKKNFQLLLLLISLVFLFGLSCKNPNSYKAAWNFSKNYVDDLFKVAAKSKNLAPVAARYAYTTHELMAARIAFKAVMPIYNSSGKVVSYSLGQANLQALEGAYRKDLYVILARTIDRINTKKIFYHQLNSEIMNLINSSDDLVANSIQFNQLTGELTISSLGNYTRLNYLNILQDLLLTSGSGLLIVKSMN